MRSTLIALVALLGVAPTRAAQVDCSFDADLASAEIGQPIACTLIVRHPAGTRANVDLASVLPSDAWVLLQEPTVLTLSRADDARVTTVDYVVAALEPGELALAAPAVMCEVDGVPTTCGELLATITVAGALGPEEDAPRPPARAPIEGPALESRYVSPLWFLLVPLAAVLSWIAWRVLRRPRGVVAESVPTARQRVEAVDMYESGAVVCAALRDALRAGHDHHVGVDRAGLTDDEWLDAPEPPADDRARFAAFFARCEAVRFGGEAPTRFALDALRQEALDLAPREATPAQPEPEVAA